MKLGPYTIREGLRRDNPAFPVYLIFLGEELVGKQFSKPGLSDCDWHAKHKGVYSTRTNSRGYGHAYSVVRRKGRPRNVEPETAEAMAV